MTNQKIDFLVVGAEKCGSTWLADMLRQHPGVFVPIEKEIHYFNRKFVDFPDLDNYNHDKPLDWYWNFFESAQPGQKLGEVSPSYLWDDDAAGCIHAFDPNVKILILLRNPAERLYSAYRFWMQRGVVGRISFIEATRRFHDLLVKRSLYFAQVKRYYDLFPANQIRVWIMDGARGGGTSRILAESEQFIGVEPFIPEDVSARPNMTGTPRFWLVNRFIAYGRRFLRKYSILASLTDLLRKFQVVQKVEILRQKNKMREAPTQISMMSDEERKYAKSLLQEDVRQLEELLKIDLGAWK